MLSSLRKLSNNFAPASSLRALGTVMYLRYLAAGVVSVPSILRNRHIRGVDRIIGRHAKTFYRDGKKFTFDCNYADLTLGAREADNYAFGIARELYIRDCYFKFLPADLFSTAKTVVDIGSNRGAFSCMMTTVARRIVSVEAFPELAAVIRHNLNLNRFADFAVEQSFLGEGGEQFDPTFPQISMKTLFDRHHLERIDLMKMDIEGSEFSLFKSPDWLRRVGAITMEVHPTCGDPTEIVKCLEGFGFHVRVADEDLVPLTDPRTANFIYAWQKS